VVRFDLFSWLPCRSSNSKLAEGFLTSPLSTICLKISCLNFSFAWSFARFSRASFLFDLRIYSDLRNISLSFFSLSFFSYIASSAYLWPYWGARMPCSTISKVFFILRASSTKKSSTRANSQGRTSSWREHSNFEVTMPMSARWRNASSLKSVVKRFAITRETSFWWAALRCDLRAFCWTPRLEISAATRASAASKR